MNEDNNGKCNEINTSTVLGGNNNNTNANANTNVKDYPDWKQIQLKALQLLQSIADTSVHNEINNTALAELFQKLVQHPNYTFNFTRNRSPFFYKEKQYCAMAVISQKRIEFRVSMESADVNIFNNKNMEQTKALHLTLFNFTKLDYQAWNTAQCNVSINNHTIKIDKIIIPLDVTKEVCRIMDFDITSYGQFSGIVLLELVHIFSTDSLCQRIKNRCKPIDKRPKQCVICYKKGKLWRCNRCKCVWYCGVKHQEQDWSYHQTVCLPLKLYKQTNAIVYEESSVISLRCPLSTAKIQTPIRGTNCLHSQCIDLKTFLLFSHDTGVWQCPVCLNPLTFNQIFIDNKMNDILKQIH
eukprot:187250_1